MLLALVTLMVVPALGGCTGPPGQAVVYKLNTGSYNSGPVQVGKLLDLGLPDIENISSGTVRMLSVRLVTRSRYVHVTGVTAYLQSQARIGNIIAAYGDLPKLCPRLYTPHPVTDVVTAPHSYPDYFVMISMTFSKPGVYKLIRVRINYETGTARGWQYQNLNDTITATKASKYYPSSCR